MGGSWCPGYDRAAIIEIPSPTDNRVLIYITGILENYRKGRTTCSIGKIAVNNSVCKCLKNGDLAEITGSAIGS